MDFIDDEAGYSEDDVLVPSSQQDSSRNCSRPGKRRRLNSFSGFDENTEDGYDLPTATPEDQEEDYEQSRSKYEEYLHVPAYVESQRDEFVTQVEQPWSSPSAMRGPRWRKKSPTPPSEPSPVMQPTRTMTQRNVNTVQRSQSRPLQATAPLIADEFDDDDAELLEALAADPDLENLTSQMIDPVAFSRPANPPAKAMRQTTLFGMNTTQQAPTQKTQPRSHNWPMASRNEPPTHHKIDREAMKTWTYPLNVGSVRDYQFHVVSRALYHNMLVALPTGLGKTFIAATVMLNFYNWTTDAQIVFVAPTKPLVTQQVEACFHIAGIPRSQTTLLTGEIQPAVRAEEWESKRVFFMTPQTLINDLKTGMADPKKIVLLVVDEAHKATGNYAYVEVVRFLRRFNSSFRVLALTATPGAHVEAVQKVIDGLDIARVEIRTEESMDIRSYVHTRNTELQLFDNSEEIEMCLELFATAVRPVLSKVNSLNAYFSNDPKTMTLYGLMMGRDKWTKSDAGRKADWGLKGMVNSCFKPLMSLAHNLELLKFHGIGPFFHKMKIFEDEAYGSGKYAKQIVESESFKKLMNRLRSWVNSDDFVGHPKLSYLNEVVLNHFMDASRGIGFAAGRPPSDTRIMIFSHYRDSAEEIVRVLNRHEPMIRAHVFVGQSNTKGSDGMDQKKQTEIITKFKSGIYNTLVATSIGEEGLDIGEVDLIVCYDCSKSPIRMLQRMGRTGRKRAGNIVLLLMRGKEERDYHSAKDNYVKIQEIIENGTAFQYHDDVSPRIVPREIQPVVDKRHVEIPIENTQAGAPEPRKRATKNAKRPPKKFHMPDGVETGFTFLGNGKKSKQKVRMPTAEPLVDVDTAELPHLADVILSTQQEDELDRRYAQVAGSETVYVEPIRFNNNPEELHRSRRTFRVKHSKYTESLIKASQAMVKQNCDWDRPDETAIIADFDDLPLRPETEERSKKKPLQTSMNRTRKRRSVRQTSETLSDSTTRPDQSDNEYDMNDNFINDNPSSSFHSQPSNADADEDQTTLLTHSSTTVTTKPNPHTPFFTPTHFSQTQDSNPAASQASNDPDEDLPDLQNVFNTKQAKSSSKLSKAKSKERTTNATTKPGKGRAQANAQRKKRGARRILSDDDDDE